MGSAGMTPGSITYDPADGYGSETALGEGPRPMRSPARMGYAHSTRGRRERGASKELPPMSRPIPAPFAAPLAALLAALLLVAFAGCGHDRVTGPPPTPHIYSSIVVSGPDTLLADSVAVLSVAVLDTAGNPVAN